MSSLAFAPTAVGPIKPIVEAGLANDNYYTTRAIELIRQAQNSPASFVSCIGLCIQILVLALLYREDDEADVG